MTHDQAHTALSYFTGRHLPPLTSAALRFLVLVATWEAHRRTRKGLKHLDAHLLADVGISRSAAQRELDRWFWQG